MVFKRRDRRPWWRIVADALYPRGGWGRSFHYVKHRVRRLPDSPDKIGRGIWAGVFTTFTPFYGLHFFIAAIIAKGMRGNILAALMATFFGNPLTYLPIGIVSLKTGHFILGTRPQAGIERSLGGKFLAAGEDLRANFMAIFTHADMDWQNLSRFYDQVFFPYMIGGIVPGIIAASICYYLSVPVIRAYQKRRRRFLRVPLPPGLRKKSAPPSPSSPPAQEAGDHKGSGRSGGKGADRGADRGADKDSRKGT